MFNIISALIDYQTKPPKLHVATAAAAAESNINDSAFDEWYRIRELTHECMNLSLKVINLIENIFLSIETMFSSC